MMKMVGLTGSIGSGKSAAVAWLQGQGVPVHDADAAVAEIYAQPETLAFIQRVFPEAIRNKSIDKNKIAEIIFENAEKKKQLEDFFHPRVSDHRTDFLIATRARNEKRVICDIPLLFETGAENEFNETWLLVAPDDVRRMRVLSRPGMTAEKFAAIDKMQMPQTEKQKRATHVIDNSGTLDELHRKLAWLIGQT